MLSLELLIEGLKPGQKEAIKIKLAKVKNWKKELQKYEDILYGHSGYKVTPEIDKKIKELKTAINAQIKQIKLEMASQPEQSLPDNLIKLLQRDCSFYLNIYRKTGEILFRGMSGKAAFKGRSMDNRRPLSATKELQEIYIALYKKLGIKAHRGNSIFCTSDVDTADGYGNNCYIIIPTNKATFSYTKYEDLNTLANEVSEISYLLVDEPLVNAYVKKARKIQDANIRKDEKNGNYYSKWNDWDPEFDQYDDSLKTWHSRLSKVMKMPHIDKFRNNKALQQELQATDKNLPKALYDQLEVCISGEYYAFKTDVYSEAFTRWLGFSINGH